MIQLWHGGSRWEGDPVVRPVKKGRAECGPGIYLTTSYDRARQYAKGPRVVTQVSLKDGMRWLEKANLPLQVFEDYVRQTRGFRKRDLVLHDLANAAEIHDVGQVPAYFLVNLCVSHDVLSGNQGVVLAEWLVSQGVDASLYTLNRAEQWVVVFNPKVIVDHRVTKPADVTLEQRECQKIVL